MSDLDILFTAYLMKSKHSKASLAEAIGVSPKCFYRMWKRGIETWMWADVLAVAKKLRIPVEVLREYVKW